MQFFLKLDILGIVSSRVPTDAECGRFRRIFEYGGHVQKSYSPYEDDLEHAYPDETFETANFLNVSDFLWDNFIERFLYGKDLERTYKRDGPIDTISIDNIEEEPDLLKMAPSVWSKIYKRELIMDNNIRFQPFISGDDMAFTLEAFLNAKGTKKKACAKLAAKHPMHKK